MKALVGHGGIFTYQVLHIITFEVFVSLYTYVLLLSDHFLLFIKMFDFIKRITSIPLHMDYKGQQYAEKLFNYILILFGICGFIWGYYCQQFQKTVLILIVGFALSCVLVLPPWPCFRRNPLPWQKPKQADKAEVKKDVRKKPKAN